MVKIRLSGKFEVSYKELLLLSPELKDVIWKRINLFREKPLDTRLYNHLLKGKLKGKWAFSVTNDIRIVYEWKTKNVVRFLAVGKHSQVYGK